MELNAEIHWEGDSLWAEVSELPGCFASGSTLDELVEALMEAVDLYVSDQDPAESRRRGAAIATGVRLELSSK